MSWISSMIDSDSESDKGEHHAASPASSLLNSVPGQETPIGTPDGTALAGLDGKKDDDTPDTPSTQPDTPSDGGASASASAATNESSSFASTRSIPPSGGFDVGEPLELPSDKSLDRISEREKYNATQAAKQQAADKKAADKQAASAAAGGGAAASSAAGGGAGADAFQQQKRKFEQETAEFERVKKQFGEQMRAEQKALEDAKLAFERRSAPSRFRRASRKKREAAESTTTQELCPDNALEMLGINWGLLQF